MRIWIMAALCALAVGCQSAYYSAAEKVGIHKRDILVDRVEESSEAQKDAEEQFQSALEHFSAVVNFDGGELEDIYDDLNDEYEDSVEAAQDVTDRINAVEDVAEALFDEWAEEIEQYSNARLKSESQRQLRETRRRYDGMIKAMRKAESRMAPVLDTFRDHVLFLKHNLNARAVASLQGELQGIETNVGRLIREMEVSIAEAQSFIKQES